MFYRDFQRIERNNIRIQEIFNTSILELPNYSNSITTELEKCQTKLIDIEILLGSKSNRQKRGWVNLIGKGLKVLFGSMDDEDAHKIHDILDKANKDESELQTEISDDIRLVKSVSDQNNLLGKNQNKIWGSLTYLKKAIQQMNFNISSDQMLEKVKRRFDEMEILMNNEIDNLKFEIQSFETSMLFLSAGVTHPYIIKPTELINILKDKNVGFPVTEESIRIIFEHLKTTALYDSKNNLVIIILRIPIVSDMLFNVYENLIVPIHLEDHFVAITGIHKYLII